MEELLLALLKSIDKRLVFWYIFNVMDVAPLLQPLSTGVKSFYSPWCLASLSLIGGAENVRNH